MSGFDPVRVARGKHRELVRVALDQGWRVDQTGAKHLRFLPPGGGRPIFSSGTPSDPRAWKNLRSHLRRAGLEV